MLRWSKSNRYDMADQRDMDHNQNAPAQNEYTISESGSEEPTDAVQGRSTLADETAAMSRSIIPLMRRIRRNEFSFNGQLGNAQPVPFDDGNQQQIARVASPVDLVPSTNNNSNFFSPTVTEYIPLPHESQAEECTTPDPMLAVDAGIHIGQRVIDRNNIEEHYPDNNNVAETTNTPTNADLLNPNTSDVIINNGAQDTPAELQHDIDFSIDPQENPDRANLITTTFDGPRLASEQSHTDNYMDEINDPITRSDMTQAANTNDMATNELSSTDRSIDEHLQILRSENRQVMTEVKDEIPTFRRTVSTEGTVQRV